MKKKVAKSYKLTLPKTYKTFYQKPTKNIDIYTKYPNEKTYVINRIKNELESKKN